MTADPANRDRPPGDATVADLVASLDAWPARDDDPTVAASGAGRSPLLSVLRDPATWDGPPPDLRDRVLRAVESVRPERDEVGAAPVVPLAPRRRRVSWTRLAWVVPAAAAVAAAFAVGVLRLEHALEPRGATFAAQGTGLTPGAGGEVTVRSTGSGYSIVIETEGFPAAAPGSYYSAWLRGPKGVVPLGSFHERRTGWPVELWSGVDPDDYPQLEVTLQAEGDPPAPSDRVVLRSSISG